MHNILSLLLSTLQSSAFCFRIGRALLSYLSQFFRHLSLMSVVLIIIKYKKNSKQDRVLLFLLLNVWLSILFPDTDAEGPLGHTCPVLVSNACHFVQSVLGCAFVCISFKHSLCFIVPSCPFPYPCCFDFRCSHDWLSPYTQLP